MQEVGLQLLIIGSINSKKLPEKAAAVICEERQLVQMTATKGGDYRHLIV